MRLSRDNCSRNGASSWQGTHHEAHTFNRVTAPWKVALLRPGIGLPSRSSPGIAGRSNVGTGWPISADGSREGSPAPSRYRNKAASARNAIRGSKTSMRLRFEVAASPAALMNSNSLAFALRAPCDAAFLEVAEDALLRRIIEHDPCDQCGDDENRHCIGSDDEIRVRPEVQALASASFCACRRRMLRTRRRNISLRMTARCKVRNNNVNASAMIRRGVSRAGSMLDPPMRKTDAG